MNSDITPNLTGIMEQMTYTFSKIINSSVKYRQITSDIVPLSKMFDALKITQEEVFIVLQTISGDVKGAAMLIFNSENSQVFSESDSFRVVSELLLDKTAKLEILNMLVGNLLTDMCSSLKITAMQSVPSFVNGKIEEVIDAVLLEFTDAENMHLILSEFAIKHLSQPVHFAMLLKK